MIRFGSVRLAVSFGATLALLLVTSQSARSQTVPDAVAGTTSTRVAAAAVGASVLFPSRASKFWKAPLPADSVPSFSAVVLPPGIPAYFPATYHAALAAPLPGVIFLDGGIPATLPQVEWDTDSSGITASYQPAGGITTATNAFFESLGSNGRSCATCHQPPNGMSVSASNIQARYTATNGRDPIFAPVDGANCPSAVSSTLTSGALLGGHAGRGHGSDVLSFRKAHSLLLQRGLIRIFLPLPANAQFTMEVVNDPNGCNTDPDYDQVLNADQSVTQIVSVYRRPLISANLDQVTGVGANTHNLPPIDLLDGSPLTPDPNHLPNFESGNIMWDGREPTLESQAVNATLGHAQALTPPTSDQVAQMVAFENGIFSAQVFAGGGGWLQLRGGQGGPVDLSSVPPGQPISFTPVDGIPMSLYSSYVAGSNALRASIIRGQHLFDTRTFIANGVAGFNNAPVIGPNFVATCGICHNQVNAGSDSIAKGQLDIGVDGDAQAFGGPAPDTQLPVFKLTCTGGATTPFNGPVVYITDPGKALITGLCSDIGRKTVPQMRALASHAPYFSNGSAKTLLDVVNFYNDRFAIGLAPQEKTDLVNFMASL